VQKITGGAPEGGASTGTPLFRVANNGSSKEKKGHLVRSMATRGPRNQRNGKEGRGVERKPYGVGHARPPSEGENRNELRRPFLEEKRIAGVASRSGGRWSRRGIQSKQENVSVDVVSLVTKVPCRSIGRGGKVSPFSGEGATLEAGEKTTPAPERNASFTHRRGNPCSSKTRL